MRFPHSTRDEDDLVEDRECQISYSILGHHEDKNKKERFDTDGKKRAAMLTEFPLARKDTAARIGGTTCIDYTHARGRKGDNVKKLVMHLDWRKKNAVYVGDAFYSGGNDESVVGVCDVVAVSDPTETLAVIQKLLHN